MTGKRRAGKDPIPPPAAPVARAMPPGMAPPPPAGAEPVPLPPRKSRREARLERKQQQRKRIGFAGGAAIVIAVIVVAGLVVFGVHKATEGGGGNKRSQTTVLLQIQAANGGATASVLLAHDTSDDQGLEVLIPARVISDVCGYNALNFGSILGLPSGATASRQTVSAMLENATIDGSWVLQAPQFVKFVDRLGGITADVDTDVVQRTAGGGGRILVPAGNGRHLTGAQALQYATYHASAHEDASAQLARLGDVINGIVAALPQSSTTLAADLRVLGAGGSSTLGTSRLTSLLLGLRSANSKAGHFLPIDLPTSLIDAGGAPSYRVDTVNARKLAMSNLKNSLPADAGARRPTVELLNGVGTPGLVALACPRLQAHHLTYAGSNNADHFGYSRSIVEVPTSKLNLGYEVAAALRLPRTDVLRTTQNQSVADVIVILGRDFK